MSGGISALRGFDYQATVILDRLLSHFEEHGTEASVRPEGVDDLDLTWTDTDGSRTQRFEQIKKLREDQNVKPTGDAWTLAEVASDLIPSAIAHLAGNVHEQVWILGDRVESEVTSLIAAGQSAPTLFPQAYWQVVHRLARDVALGAVEVPVSARRRLVRWAVPADLAPDPDQALVRVTTMFRQQASALGAGASIADAHGSAVRRFHSDLPDVLARIRILSLFGSEEEVALRVRERLEVRYSLQPSVVEATLFRNLRGFINDVSKQPGRRFDQQEFESELRSVWPVMLSVTQPPPLDEDHVFRTDMSARFTTGWSGRALEAIGISGAGKTLLAAEVYERSRTDDPERIVLYAEARPETELRNVLVGVGFHLRRLGFGQPFAAGVEGTVANDLVLDRLAQALSAIPKDLLLIIDLVEGTCGDAFARNLAGFVKSLHSGACRIAVFGQESAFRYLNALDRDRLRVGTIDVRGFNIDEFVSLVLRRHPAPDYVLIHDVFRIVTAGRAAGLYARLARSLADASSLESMRDMARRPADEILEHADQQRFAKVSDSARPAAEKLICFALPFQRSEAEAVFPNENVGAAVRELLTLGLLRATGEGSYEMHEIVRAGLEGVVAFGKRCEAHGALAVHYAQQGNITAEVFHLDRAKRSAEARNRARTAFLQGKRWAGLAGFVTAHRLVTPSELIRVVAGAEKIEDIYELSYVLSTLHQSVDVARIIAVLRQQPQRFLSDYQWASSLVDACLAFEPARFQELIQFSLSIESKPDRREAGLSVILIASRRHGCVLTPETLLWYDGLPTADKRLLLPTLLADGRREALTRAFAVMEINTGERADQRRETWSERSFEIAGRERATEFLAALPDVPDHVLLALNSPLLGTLASIVWRNRHLLQTHCIDLVQRGGVEPKVQKAAIRVLAFLAEPRLCELCEALAAQRSNPVHGFAALAPSLAPTLIDHNHYEARLLDHGQDVEPRMVALTMLAAVGADLGSLYDRLRATSPSSDLFALWDFLFLQLSARVPFPAAIPLLEAHLQSPDADGVGVFVGALTRLGRLPGHAAIEMLLRAIAHPNSSVRIAAVMSLVARRSKAALTGLAQRFHVESETPISCALATAIVASGARSADDLAEPPHEAEHISLWRCVLAARTRDVTFATQLVSLARNTSANWQLRRAAIHAAGFLPFDAALEHMLPILHERSPLTFDDQQSLHLHAMLSWLLLSEAQALLVRFKAGRARFVGWVAGILDDSQVGLIDPRGLPSNEKAAEWLYDRLQRHGWPENLDAPDIVINELHIPILHSAILRALRRVGRIDLIEAELGRADHVWIATKCLLACIRAGLSGADQADRLANLLKQSAVAGDPRLDGIVAEAAGTRQSGIVPGAEPPPLKPVAAQKGVTVSYEEAVRILSGDGQRRNFEAQAPIGFVSLTPEQFEHLARLADPLNDPERRPTAERYVPEMRLHAASHTVAQWQRTYSGGFEGPGAWIRPALAAANHFDCPLRWHEEVLSGPLAGTYAERLFACLAAAGDADAFYRTLYGHPHLLISQIISYGTRQRIAAFLDDRLIPFLHMHLPSGTDEVFEGLCGLARAITSPAIDTVLSALLRRWTGQLNGLQAVGACQTSHHVWRAFRDITDHPRFNHIQDWYELLSPVMHAPLEWYHKEQVTRVLERDSRSYIQLESLLFRSEDWAHFYVDEIDRLELAVERLFDHLEA